MTATAVYDLALRLRVGGGSSGTRPFNRIAIGEVGRKVLLPSTNAVWVDTDRRTVELRDGSGVYLRSLPWAVRPEAVVDGPDAVTRTIIAADWLPIPAGDQAVYHTDPSVAGWGQLDLTYVWREGYWR